MPKLVNMKNTFFLFAIILLLAACSKDKKTTPAVKLLDVTGSWSTYSQDDTFFTLGNVTADQFPCIADNVITFNPDSSYTSKYIGANVCWITPQHGGNGSISFGDPPMLPKQVHGAGMGTTFISAKNIMLYQM